MQRCLPQVVYLMVGPTFVSAHGARHTNGLPDSTPLVQVRVVEPDSVAVPLLHTPVTTAPFGTASGALPLTTAALAPVDTLHGMAVVHLQLHVEPVSTASGEVG